MAVPSSGSISLYGLAKEVHLNDYNNSIPAPGTAGTNWNTFSYPSISLKNMSTGTGGFDDINTLNGIYNRPDESSPHSMSEFHAYDHDRIKQIGGTYTGAVTSTSWQGVSINVSTLKGMTVRFIFHYVSGTSYTGDLQIDSVGFPKYYTYADTGGYFQGWAANTSSFGTSSFTNVSSASNGGYWQTTTTDTSSYVGASWSTVTVGTTALRWNGRTGGTPSSGTGLSSGVGGSGYYVYAETSNPGYSNKNFWLRSGTHTITSQSGTPYFSFQLGRYGATIGTLKVYVEKI